jgi:hypothetical protein
MYKLAMMREDGGGNAWLLTQPFSNLTFLNRPFIGQPQPSKSVVHLTDIQNSTASADSNLDGHARPFMYVWLVVMFIGRLRDIA